MASFKVVSKFKPTGDQPKAIKQLTKNLNNGVKHQVLLGVTGSGKTFTMAKVIEATQKPTLIISPNKTLAAQLYQEFKDFFPDNAVHYFVSYYDYYQPEAYIPHSDTYIQKDAKVNEEIDRLRHAAVQDVISRKDVIVVASVSCIYNIGSPENYEHISLEIKTGQKFSRKNFLLLLLSLQYKRNEIEFFAGGESAYGGKPGSFRARGDIIEIFSVTGKNVYAIEFENEIIKTIWDIKISEKKLKNKNPKLKIKNFRLMPAVFWIAPQEKIKIAIQNIKTELEKRVNELNKQSKHLEAERLLQRTNYDIEMLEENGFCNGIENYSSHLEFRKPGQPPFSLIDYFNYFNPTTSPLIFIDESHISVPQIRAMAAQDKIRKQTLIDFGFRLPSAIDNRPLNFKEFEERQKQTIYVSATPAHFEKQKSGNFIIEQIIRPTGLLEPSIEIRKTKNQIKNLIIEIQKTIEKKQRVLIVTITKRLSEEIADYLIEKKIKTQYLHSEVKTLERPEILKNLREGKYDVLVGINLLREGIDLPEVSLVAILDADKEGFLRNETTLIQTMGRASRHMQGRVILYADKITLSMQNAIKEINRRRKIQEKYNEKQKIIPKPIIKDIRNWELLKREEIAEEFLLVKDKKLLEKEMKEAAKNLDFERAAILRDTINKLAKK